MANIIEVAEAAGVSTASVSRVLAGIKVRGDARERVLAAVDRLGYRPNRAARALRSNTSTTIALVVADIQNSFFTRVCRAVEDVASAGGFGVCLCNSDEDPEKESRYLQLLREESVAGVILAPTAVTCRSGFSAVAEPLGNVPVVLIDRSIPGAKVDTVVIDNVQAAEALTGHFIDHGRRRIAGIFGAGSITGGERFEGFTQALEGRGRTVDQALIRFVPPRELEGFEAARELLAIDPPPDALITSNGLLAAGAFRALTESGFTSPGQVAFGSFDETAWANLVTPAVTVIDQPTYEIGRTATDLLLQRIREPARPPRNVILSYRLQRRSSCGCGTPRAH